MCKLMQFRQKPKVLINGIPLQVAQLSRFFRSVRDTDAWAPSLSGQEACVCVCLPILALRSLVAYFFGLTCLFANQRIRMMSYTSHF